MSIEFVEIGPLDYRRRCDCCGYPTLSVANEDGLEPDWRFTSTSCALCEWESAPLDDGQLRPDAAADAERNDGLSIDIGRDNFARFSSIYDPNALPVWKLVAPSDDVLECRCALQVAYDEVLSLDAPDRHERWMRVRACESALAAAVDAQQARDEEGLSSSDLDLE